MSDSATFEFETVLEIEAIASQIAKFWNGNGYNAEVYTRPDYRSDRIFCLLEYFYGYPDEQKMLRDAVDYLLAISLNHQVYYYRCADFAHSQDEARSIVQIYSDDLFQKEFSPSLQATIEEKYLICGS